MPDWAAHANKFTQENMLSCSSDIFLSVLNFVIQKKSTTLSIDLFSYKIFHKIAKKSGPVMIQKCFKIRTFHLNASFAT